MVFVPYWLPFIVISNTLGTLMQIHVWLHAGGPFIIDMSSQMNALLVLLCCADVIHFPDKLWCFCCQLSIDC